MFNIATTLESPTTQVLRDYVKNIDNNGKIIFDSPTILTEVFNTVGFLKNNKAVGIDGVSAEVLKNWFQ